MTNEQLAFGVYNPNASEKTKDIEHGIKHQAKVLLDILDESPMDESIRASAKKDIVTGVMWAIKGIYACNQ